MKKIGYLGPKGTFSYETALNYTNEENLVAYQSIPDLMVAVIKDELDEAILPIENSIEGSVVPTLDLLLDSEDVEIIGELTHKIHENLMVKKGAKIEDIQVIASHSQPLGQCRKYLYKNFPNIKLESVNSTALAAQMVKNSNGEIASIGSITGADIYELEILKKNIEDEDFNVTRFIIVGKTKKEKGLKNKTSIVFSLEHRPGTLYKILGILDLWEVNMLRIESRPSKEKLGTYIFYVDIEGHIDDSRVSDALEMVKRKTTLFKLLGSYKIAE